MRFNALILTIAAITAPAAMLSAQTLFVQPPPTQPAQNLNLSFNNFYTASQLGCIKHSIYAEVTTLKIKHPVLTPTPYPGDFDDPDPLDTRRTIKVNLLTNDYCNYYPPNGDFGPWEIKEIQARKKGVSQEAIDAVKNTPNAISVVFKEAYLSADNFYNNLYGIAAAYRAKGTVVLNATIPSHTGNRWVLRITSALPEEKYYPLSLTQGQHKITVTDVEAGNVLAALFAVDANGAKNSYYQEAYALVRKNGITSAPGGIGLATIDMTFAEQNASDRYRIGYMGAGHNSQSSRASLPLQKGREAMIRVMAYDAWGNGGQPSQSLGLNLYWPGNASGAVATKAFTTQISGNHAQSGKIFIPSQADTSRNEWLGLGPKIPGDQVQPSLSNIIAQLYNPANGAMLNTKIIYPTVVKPREIYLRGYDFTATTSNFTLLENGWEYADKPGWLDQHVLEPVRDITPYAVIRYAYIGRLAITTTAANHLDTVLTRMNDTQGNKNTNLSAPSETLYLGWTNGSRSDGAVGIAQLGKRGLAVNVSRTPYSIGHTVTHEIGHCFGIKHSPSSGADADPNWVDNTFPYGGGGMAGGWGYAKHLNPEIFLAEDDHKLENILYSGKNASWDVMAYAPLYPGHRRFSDYNTDKLIPRAINSSSNYSASMMSAAPEIAPHQIPGIKVHPETGILIYGAEAARAAEAAWNLEKNIDVAQFDAEAAISGDLGSDEDVDVESLVKFILANSNKRPLVIFTHTPVLKGIEHEVM